MTDNRFIIAVDNGGDSWSLYIVNGDRKADVIKGLYDWLRKAERVRLPPVRVIKKVEENSPQFLFSLPIRKKEN